MQRETSMARITAQPFYNFRNKECSIKIHSSYNFERSDPRQRTGRPVGLKIVEKLNQKMIKDMCGRIAAQPFYNFRNKFFYNFERSDPNKIQGF